MIVFPDADYEKALAGAVRGMNFAWSGQSCGSTSRLFIHESLYDKFLADLVAEVGKLKIGDPLSEDSKMGPMNSKAQLEKVMHYIKAGKEDGAQADDRRQAAGRRDVQEGLVGRADRVRRREARHAHRPGRNLRAGAVGVQVEGRRRGDRDRQFHRIRPHRRDLDQGHQHRDEHGAQGCSPATSGSTASPATSRACRSAASRTPASAARRGSKSCSPTPRKKPSTSCCKAQPGQRCKSRRAR